MYGLNHLYLIEDKGNAGVSTDYGGLPGIEYYQVNKKWIKIKVQAIEMLNIVFITSNLMAEIEY